MQSNDDINHPPPDLACRLCHGDSESVITFPSGETLPVQVDLALLASSVHGQAEDPIACADCHRPANDYKLPHAPVDSANLRSYQVEKALLCENCHVAPHPTAHPGTESENPVTCTDCHGGHDVLGADVFQSEGGTAVCVQCHTAENVTTTNPATLTSLVQNGFFSDQPRDNNYCLGCHSQPDFLLTFENGDTLSLTINEEDLANSVHGTDNSWQPLACTNCHGDYDYPHEPVPVTTEREYHLYKYTACANCHEQNYEKASDSVHGAALEAGNEEAAVCTDCHGAHDTPVPNEPRERISHTCEQCHSTIFMEYADSVHGDALLSESNPDVPTCIECHGVHDINDPTTALARLRSPQLCASCHADEALMTKYEISTEVFDTYVSDFHGTTVTLFEHQDPNAETNKAVCYDCHGVHSIKKPDDPQAGIKNNLLETCQQCHPDATANFSDAWTSHFQPSLEHNPLVYLVNLFYQIVIPLTIAVVGFLILTDVYRRVRERVQRAARS
jgi:predicted CXXCH cytochrome family protein